MNYKLMLLDRIQKIQAIDEKYNLKDNSYISFSGGKDSTILHYLIDMALPNNKIPRVFFNTGIEYFDIVDFVKDLASKDSRFVILPPKSDIKKVLEENGYPFKSKQHSHDMMIYQRNKELCDNIFNEIDNNKQLLFDNNYIDSLPLGTKTLVKYKYGIRQSGGGNIYLFNKGGYP